ncbi:polysialyltransferase family glycosyltransferase [Aquimarina rubra]|uniref:Polysialyltransferase family glycosyltransferase n=1 Tax=Aquimarina rubra TaxID=1920033 RepID=A0ABW5LF87_9FLAO
MKKINYIILIVTPFHKKVVFHLFPDLLNREDVLILFSEYVDFDRRYLTFERLKSYGFSRRELFNNPFGLLKSTLHKVNSIKQEIKLLKKKYAFSNELKVLICSDKDIFTQILINKTISKNYPNRRLIAIEEGIGFYSKIKFKDLLLSFSYKMITPILFGIRLHYFKRLGCHPKINDIYLRVPELLDKKRKNLNYIKFFLNTSSNDKRTPSKGTCLLYSFPEQDSKQRVEVKINIIKIIAGYLDQKGKKLVIKPHPRENSEVLISELSEIKNVTILDKSVSGEEIDYFEYEQIFNFFSSIIIDILDKKYPPNKLITIGSRKKCPIEFSEEMKYIPINKFSTDQIEN